MSRRIGRLSGPRTHRHWAEALDEVRDLPTDALALIWLRHRDRSDRETVGHLMWAINRGNGVEITDSTGRRDSPPMDADPFELRVFRVPNPVHGVRG